MASVFISYASPDIMTANELYESLEKNGHKPWMDKKSITPGETWNRSIRNAISESDIVLILITKNSINKRGYFQKEIKIAIDCWKEKLIDDIYLIPILFHDVAIPEILQEFQCYLYDKHHNFDSLCMDIDRAMRQKNDEIEPIEHEIFFHSSESYPKYKATVHYPRIVSTIPKNVLTRLNAVIATRASGIFENFIGDHTEATNIQTTIDIPSELNVEYSVTYLSEAVFSLAFRCYLYFSGAAHGNHEFFSINFTTEPFREICLSDLFIDSSGWQIVVGEWCYQDLKRQLTDEKDNGISDSDWFRWVQEKPEEIKFNIFPKYLQFSWAPYEVGPFAWGPRQVKMPLEVAIKNKIAGHIIYELLFGK